MKKKLICFFMMILMMLGCVSFSEVQNNPIMPASATSIVESPTRNCIYLLDENHYWDKYKDRIYLSLSAFLAGEKVVKFEECGDGLYMAQLPLLQSLFSYATLTIYHLSINGQPIIYDKHVIKKGESIFDENNDYDAIFRLEKDRNTYETVQIFNKKYVYFAYDRQKDDVIYCEYTNSYDVNDNYRIPMIYSGFEFNNIHVYRACLYSPSIYLEKLSFIVEDFTDVDVAKLDAITSKTPAEVWENKVYYIDNWYDYRDINYTITFDFNGGHQSGNSEITYKEITVNQNTSFTMIVPDDPVKENSTFVGWYLTIDGQEYKMDYKQGNTVFINSNTTVHAKWQKGKAVFIYVDGTILSKLHNQIGIAQIILGFGNNVNSATSLTQMKMTPHYDSTVYEAIISLGSTGVVKEITNLNLSYTFDGLTYYNTHLFTLGTAITENRNGTKYHFMVPKVLELQDLEVQGFEFNQLYSIKYYYGDNYNKVYTRFPVSIKYIYPVLFERQGYRLEAWYLNKSHTIKFEAGTVLNSDTDLYARYIEARDYYFYVDNYQNQEWAPTSITLYNDYFLDLNFTFSIPSSEVKNLGHNIYQVKLDTSKSFSDFYVSGEEIENKEVTRRTESKPLLTEYTYFDITNKKDDKTNTLNIVNTEIYGDCLVGAQKIPYNKEKKENAFRFTIGVPSEINNYYQNKDDPNKPQDGSQTNLGFKVVFIQNNSCYIGFWNFDEAFRLDYIRLDKLYQKNKKYGAHSYVGFYSLTIRDDITFKYSSFNHLIIVGVYKDSEGKLKVVKATEYSIVTREGGNVDIYYQANHIITRKLK